MAEIARHLIIGAHVLNIVSNSENLVDDTGIEPVTYISIYPYRRNSYLVQSLHEWADMSILDPNMNKLTYELSLPPFRRCSEVLSVV